MDEPGLPSLLALLFPDFGALPRFDVTSVSPLLVILISLIGIWTIRFSRARRKDAGRSLQEAQALLEGVDHQTFPSRRSELRAKAEQCSRPVAEAWREFDAALVRTDDQLLIAAPAEMFFHERRFAPRLIDHRVLHAAPAILTTLGLLGTFVGLTAGLRNLDLGSSTDELRSGVQTLVTGAAIGFNASLWGVGFSLVTNLAVRMQEQLVLKQVRELQSRIDALSTMHAPEQSLSQIAAHTEESTEALQTLHEKIGNALQESVTQVGDQTSRAVSSAIHESLAPIMTELSAKAAEQSADVFKEVSGLLTTSFKEMGETVAERLQSSSDSLRATIDYMGEQLARQADEHRSRAKELEESTARTARELQEATTTQIERITEAATHQIERITEATGATTRALTEAVDRQRELLEGSLPTIVDGLDRSATRIVATSEGIDKVVDALDSVSTELDATGSGLRTMLRDSVNAVQELTDTTTEAAETVASQQDAATELTERSVAAAEQLKHASSLVNNGYDAMRASQDHFLKGLQQNLEGYVKEMSGWLSDYSEQVSKQTAHRMDEWNLHTERFTSTMVTATQALSDAVGDLGERPSPTPVPDVEVRP